jgi:hypothetical protein
MPFTAVDLDNLLTNITPETAWQLRALIPEHIRDGYRAATTESIAMMETVGNKPARRVSPHDVDDWLRLGVLD